MNITDFIQTLAIQGWKIWSENNKLCYDAPQGSATSEALDVLKQHKLEILELLRDNPENFQLESALALTNQEIEHFHDKGWIGPLDAFSPAEIDFVLEYLKFHSVEYKIDGTDNLSFYNNIYNHNTDRDQYLFHQPIADLFASPKIVRRLNQLGEPDLLLWRTNVFAKSAGLGKIAWHQAFEHFTTSNVTEKQSLFFPEDNDDILNLTVWIALTDSTIENGCMRFANGTHKTRFEFVNHCIPASEGVFGGINAHKSRYQNGEKLSGAFIFDESQWEVEPVTAKAGQIIIFTERCMHTSHKNCTDRRRIAVNGRYIRPNVGIYSHRLQGDFIDENHHNIENHFSLLVSGKDDYQINAVRSGHGLNEIEVEFQNMLNLLVFEHVEHPQGEKAYELKSLYKQATEGDCEEAEPEQDSGAHLLWAAWKSKYGMNKSTAMTEYSKLVSSLPMKAGAIKTGLMKAEPIKAQA